MDRPSPQPGWSRLDALLDEALDLPLDQRQALLDRVGRDHPALRHRIERLLAADAAAGDFMDDGADAWLRGPPATAAPDDPGALGPGARVGPYRVLDELGRGGMGIVYRAERADGEFAQVVALKVLRRVDGDDATVRFRRERQILARLDHPSIARLLDGGLHTDGRPYFAMELVDGAPITTFCDRHGLSIDARVRLLCRVCEAVQYAHGRLIVHRDLKPANIFVTTTGDLKLLDFGIAKLLVHDDAPESATLTRTGVRPLTPAYAAPEQLQGEPVSTATDVYALGVILFELLTGRRPPAATISGTGPTSDEAEPPRPSAVVTRPSHDDTTSIDAIARARGVGPRGLAARLAGDLDAIVLKALRREPQRRYVGAGALAEDLERFLQGRPVSARPEGRRYRAGKFVRRHRLGLAVAASLVLSLVGGLAATAWQARAKALEAQKAEAVKGFLISIFQGADPAQAAGRDITLRQVLDDGAGRVHRDLAGQPAVQGELLTLLGGIYAELGVLDRAAALTEQAFEIHARHLGADSAPVATNLRQKASLAVARGDPDTADRLVRDALARHRRTHGNVHPDVAEDLDVLLIAARQRGRLADALTAAEESLRVRRALYGGEHRSIADSLNNLAAVRREQGRYEEAAALYGQALDLRRRLLGDDHPHVALTLHNLSAVQLFRGELQQASALSREALGRFRRLYGEDHQLTLSARNNGANMDRMLGRFDVAEAELRSVLDAWARTQGTDHPNALLTLAGLGRVLRERGDPTRSEQILRDADERWHRRMGARHPMGAAIRRQLGSTLAANGRYDEAGARLRDALDRMRATHGPSHPEVAETLHELGQLARRRGDLAEATARLGEAVAMRRALLGDTHVLTAESLAGLGAARLAGDDAAGARLLLEEAVVVLRRALPASHPSVVSATRDLERARRGS